MRDNTIYTAFAALENNLTNDVMTIHNMNVLVKTRLEATENVLFGSPTAMLKAMIGSIFKKNYVMGKIHDEHELLLNEYNEKMKRSQKIKTGVPLGIIKP